MKDNTRLTCIDLFAGAGGFSLGVSQAGFNVVAAVEIDKGTCQTLQANKEENFPNMLIIEKDIRELSGAELLDMVDMKCGELFLLVGSPPCQSFSFANTKNRSIDDPRSKLMFEYIRMVKELQPKVFYIENVPGLFAFKDFFYSLLLSLEECGYIVRFLIMDACSYGVPQQRKRMFIQGARNDSGILPSFPAPTNFDPEALNGSIVKPSRAEVAKKCFQVNGFTKEEIKEVWWNTKLWIQMKKKTAAEKVDQAINECIGEGIVEHFLRTEFNKRIKTLKLDEQAKEELFKIFKDCWNTGFECLYCGRKMSLHFENEYSFTIDHYLARSKGGKDIPDNLVFCCRDCNFLKSDMSAEKYLKNMERLKSRKNKRESRKARKSSKNDKRTRDAYVDIFERRAAK